jgi:hypothetical protein
VPVGVELGKAGPAAGEAGRVQIGIGTEDEHVGLERGVAAAHDLLAQADDIVKTAQRGDLHLLRPLQAIRPAVRPVEADAVADRPPEQLVDGHAERLGLEVEQGILDGADRLLDHAPAGLATDGVELGDDGLEGPGIATDHLGGQPVDHRGDAEPAERLVVLAPADQPIVGGELEEVEVALAGIGVQVLHPGDLHGVLPERLTATGASARPRTPRTHA